MPVHRWTEVLDACRQGPACWNMDPGLNQTFGDEDCLHLNIYVQKKVNIILRFDRVYNYVMLVQASDANQSLPVLVFLHGGAFMFGSSGTELYGPDYFMMQPLVLITLNYRLGAFGKL